ncbi:hypothetical protein C8F01DRAFT_1254112 [Mycena amicta]|nr:hypothetical protein C8F01DRAFT_1254112 [Mycena amicta]
MHMKVPVGFDESGNTVLSQIPKTRFFSVFSTTDHSTATSHSAWMQGFDDIMDTYNRSPLGKRTGTLDLRLICRRLRGMCGDHANNEKALSDQWRQTKYDELLNELGEKRMKELDAEMAEMADLMRRWNEQKIADVGGIAKWNALSAAERAARDLATTTAMVLARNNQLEKLRRLWNPDKKKPKRIDIPVKSHIPKLDQKKAALADAFVAHLELLKVEMAVAGNSDSESLFGSDSDSDEGGQIVDKDYWEEEDDDMEELA